MLKNQCISVTKLRTNTKECLEGLACEPKYIFVNNQPVAVLMDIDDYESHFSVSGLTELTKEQITPGLLRKARATRKMSRKELINI